MQILVQQVWVGLKILHLNKLAGDVDAGLCVEALAPWEVEPLGGSA